MSTKILIYIGSATLLWEVDPIGIPEVRIVVRRDQKITVGVDKAVARTYVRINAAIDQINKKRFFGEPFTVSVRDDLSPEELRAFLQGSGVLHVREDLLDEKC